MKWMEKSSGPKALVLLLVICNFWNEQIQMYNRPKASWHQGGQTKAPSNPPLHQYDTEGFEVCGDRNNMVETKRHG